VTADLEWGNYLTYDRSTDRREIELMEKEGPAAPTAAQIFGSTSDGGWRLSEFCEVMCRGCVHESPKRRAAGDGGGAGCEIADRAYGDPYGAPMPEWSLDGVWLPHMTDGDDAFNPRDPWPVCMAYERRPPRKPPRPRELPGQMDLFQILAEDDAGT